MTFALSELEYHERRPVPAESLVARGRDQYLASNGFSIEAYDAKFVKATVLGIPFAFPNTRTHRRAIMLHDLHHVATGYSTDRVGEGELAAWEIRRGLSGIGFYTSTLVVGLAVIGLVSAPRRVLRAWRAGKGGERQGSCRLKFTQSDVGCSA